MNILLISSAILAICEVSIGSGSVVDSEWTGQMFPDTRNALEPSTPKASGELQTDNVGRVKMGVRNKQCDDAADPLGIDDDVGPKSYVCFDEKSKYRPNPNIHPKLHVDNIPKGYIAMHYCMNESIIYEDPLPTYGTHRPLWPKYGEYSFVPRQRWLHNLEHGSIVMLYHPCADLNEVTKLRNIVENCLYQYVISASKQLTSERPLALLAWGARLEISMIQPEIVINFMRSRAFKAPEFTSREGQYDINLIKLASRRLVGQEKNICPND